VTSAVYAAGVATMAKLFGGVTSVYKLMRAGKRDRDEQTDNALRALYVALTETYAYAEELRNGKANDRKREYEIAGLWNAASIPLRHVDRRLAERCNMKGSYWMEPEVWDAGRVRRNAITLRRMADDTKKLLTR